MRRVAPTGDIILEQLRTALRNVAYQNNYVLDTIAVQTNFLDTDLEVTFTLKERQWLATADQEKG